MDPLVTDDCDRGSTARRSPGAQGELRWLLAALALGAALIAIDLLLGRSANLSGAMAVVPFLAALGATPLQTAALAAGSVTAAVALHGYDDVGQAPGAVRIAVVALSATVAVVGAARRVARERRLVGITRVADVAQQAVLVPVPEVAGSFRLAGSYVSAAEEAQLGGDFYQVVECAEGVRVVVGDVRGKGVGAISLAAFVLRAFRDAALTRPTLEQVVDELEAALASHLDAEDFVTAVLVELHPDGSFDIANCGHHPPVLLHEGHSLVETTPTTPFGLAPSPHCRRLLLGRDERLLLYTDGLVEARQGNGEFVPLSDLVSGLEGEDLPGAVSTIVARLEQVAGPLADDLAVLMIEVDGDTAADEERDLEEPRAVR